MSQPQAPSSQSGPSSLTLMVNGQEVEVPDVGETLLSVLRDRLGLVSAKDGCSPQGQCGCCTVLVDGSPRVACVTPARRVRGRGITTLEGLDNARRQRWGDAFCAAGASQCGFCTPGIVVRLDALSRSQKSPEGRVTKRAVAEHAVAAESTAQATAGGSSDDEAAVNQALLAHLCRCTGWQTIHEAWRLFVGDDPITDDERDYAAAAERAELEGRAAQTVSADVALGLGGFAADTAPADSMVAVADGSGDWVVGESLTAARTAAGKVQGRRTTAKHRWPLDVPDGEWAATLRTTWVDAAYLETDASWCEPGGEPSSSVANGGAFGAKQDTAGDGGPQPMLDVRAAARRLADQHGRPVLALASREDVAAGSPKRPPVAGGMSADGTGLLRVVATPGIVEAVASVAPGLTVEQVSVPGPPTSISPRAAGWAEALVLQAGASGELQTVRSPDGAEADAVIEDGIIKVAVACGRVLDKTVLRSFCIGAAHMAWSWLTSEAMLVDAEGVVHDLTVRSFGVLRAVDTPPIEVEIIAGDRAAVNGSDAVFAAVAAAGWLANDCAQDWPIG